MRVSVCAILILLPLWVQAQNKPKNEPKSEIDEALRSAVADTKKNLGSLEPWQKKIFDEEVLTEARKFIRDFRSTTAGIQVDVDREAIQHYLAFSASKAFKQPKVKLSVQLQLHPGCEVTSKTTESMKKLMRTRMENRGFLPLFQSTQEPIVFELGCSEEPDEEERHFLVRSRMQIHGKSFNHQLVLLEGDSIEVATSRLLIDSFIDLGSSSSFRESEQEKTEILMTLSGVESFSQLTRLKTLLSKILTATLLERKISKGQFVFVVESEQSITELRQALLSFILEPSDRMIRMELQ